MTKLNREIRELNINELNIDELDEFSGGFEMIVAGCPIATLHNVADGGEPPPYNPYSGS